MLIDHVRMDKTGGRACLLTAVVGKLGLAFNDAYYWELHKTVHNIIALVCEDEIKSDWNRQTLGRVFPTQLLARCITMCVRLLASYAAACTAASDK